MKARILSIDIFRGLTIMLMITVNTPGSWTYVHPSLLHAKWHGVNPADLVFPFFLFAIGLSMSISWAKNQQLGKAEQLEKLLKRSLLIVLVGFLLNWFPFYTQSLFEVRVFGILQRIGLSYLLAGSWLLLVGNREQLLIPLIVILLLGYWGITTLGGDYTLEGNLNNKIDHLLLPEINIYKGFGIRFDPEGILGIISSSAQILIAYLLGLQLMKYRDNLKQFLKIGSLAGIVFLVVGALWGLVYPINKPLWTSSYVLYTSGLAACLLVLLVYILDILKIKSWSLPLRVFGMNPLFSFLLSIILVKILATVIKIDGKGLYGIIYQTIFQPTFGNYLGSFVFAITMVLIVYGAAYLLYRRSIVVKL
ncbi:MAG: heparan-alpha-glucosaminide N-acetyltransferase domain-containing protein [Bacteroidota bacterium]